MSQILVVDDEPAICWGLKEALTDEGHEVVVANSGEAAIARTKHWTPDVVLMDVCLPGMSGVDTLSQIHKLSQTPVPVVIMTAFGSLDVAVNSLSAGAFDYLPKPFDLDQAVSVVERALHHGTLSNSPLSGAPGIPSAGSAPTLLGRSAPMQRVFKEIALVSQTGAAVLITGESGTGKELVADAIHLHSARRTGPFIPICLGALSPQLIESELFGHMKGAFTGADTPRQGLLQMADQGTVFLDEIGDVPLPIQVKLLRAIERKEVTPVGDPRPRPSDFRVIAATNRSLPELVSQGEFRADLFFRLGAFQMQLPPLRERGDDIAVLAEHFLRLTSPLSPGFTAECLSELTTRHWPGNVRELRNAVEHAAILARQELIGPAHLPEPNFFALSERAIPPIDSPESLAAFIDGWVNRRASTLGDTSTARWHEELLAMIEPPLLRAALSAAGGNRTKASDLLGWHRGTLREKLRKYGMEE